MPSEQRTTQTTNQQSTTNPWAPTQSSLMDLISRFSSLGQQGPTTGQTDALSGMASAAANLPNLGPDALNAIKNMFNSSTSGAVDMLNSGYQGLMKNIGATASGAELDPYKTPGFADSISRMTGDITDKVKSLYNASGRDPSGAGSFAGSLGKGLTEGIAPFIQSQFNTNNANRFNAANQLFNASGSTAGALTQQNQVPIENAMRAIGAAGSLPGLYMQPAGAQYDVATRQADLPWSNVQRYLQSILPIAALGGQSTGSGTTERVTPDSTMGNIFGGISGLVGLGQQMGGVSGILGGLTSLGSFFSDRRVKENVEEIGETTDGQPLYLYNYIGDTIPRIGLMAQDVEKVKPEAVGEVDGIKVVDYDKALAPSRRIGMLHQMLEAA